MSYSAKREPEFLPDRSGVYLQGVYTFEELIGMSLDDRLAPGETVKGVERQPHCTAIDHTRCDYPDCPCGQP